MRIPAGKVDQRLYFNAVDPLTGAAKTGLSGFAVYRSRNGVAATAWTTPTITELSSANMPGVYALLVDEDTTIDAASDSEELCLYISHASIAPVTRTVELYRRETTSGKTLLVDDDGRVDVAAVLGTAQTAGDLAELLATLAAYVDTEVAAIKAKTDNLPSDPADQSVIIAATDAILAAVGDLPTADQAADALLDRADAIETGITVRGALRLGAAADGGRHVRGNSSTEEVFYNAEADTKARITADVAQDGTRSNIVLDLT